uniref:Bcl-2 Bcl-2 homology region 1-3 domain-containing protein n=1 Tax=Myotis lucifugus TaxID=59463 RepID=G1QAV8_MYOLU
MFGPKRNAFIGLNLHCGGAVGGLWRQRSLHLLQEGGPCPQESGAGRETGTVIGWSAGASPQATLARDPGRVARPSPMGTEGPDGTAAPARWLFSPISRNCPEELGALAADAIMSPGEELGRYEPEPKQPAVLPLLQLVGEASEGPAGGSLPSTPPPAEEEEELSLLEMIPQHLRERAGARDQSQGPRVGGVQRRAAGCSGVRQETAFLGMLELDTENEDNVKSSSQAMVHAFRDGVTNGRIVTHFFWCLCSHLKSINQESCIEPLAEDITDVLVGTERGWLVKQRGWDGFVEFFQVEDLEGGVRNVLLAFAGAGVGAGLPYLIR